MMSTATIKQTSQDVERQRQELLSKLDWHVRSAQKKNWKCEKDVTIAINKAGAKYTSSFDIYFRNGTAELIDEGVGRLAIAFIENRAYFMPNDNGYKISATKNPERKTVRMKLSEDYSNFAGNFDLKFDSFLKLYYVEKEATK